MTLDRIATELESSLSGSLPGMSAQLRLAPRPREGWSPGEIPPGLRDAAALILLFPLGTEPALVLTLRGDGLPSHAGQVSLPGGAVELGESIEQAALREASEEIGIDLDAVRVLGRLSPLHVPVSGFVLHPVVGFASRRPRFQPHAGEVARVLEVPLERLADPRHVTIERRSFRGRDYEVPFVEVEGERLWGATAMVLAEFLTLIGHAPDPWSQRVP